MAVVMAFPFALLVTSILVANSAWLVHCSLRLAMPMHGTVLAAIQTHLRLTLLTCLVVHYTLAYALGRVSYQFIFAILIATVIIVILATTMIWMDLLLKQQRPRPPSTELNDKSAVHPPLALVQPGNEAAMALHFKGDDSGKWVLLNIDVDVSASDQSAMLAVERVLIKNCASTDWVSRIGNTQFQIVRPANSSSAVLEFADLLRLRIMREMIQVCGQERSVGIGISDWFCEREQADDAYVQAQRALDEAKTLGGICLTYRPVTDQHSFV